MHAFQTARKFAKRLNQILMTIIRVRQLSTFVAKLSYLSLCGKQLGNRIHAEKQNQISC